jgi:aryl-alcohol dehydrogenase-like predicted oxidoreductase
MKTNRIGNADLKSSAIGFGCWELGGTYGTFDNKEIVEAIHQSIDLGVTLFDTAHVYGYDSVNQPDGAGRSEQLLWSRHWRAAERRPARHQGRESDPSRPEAPA